MALRETLTFNATTDEIIVFIEILGDNVLEDDKETFFAQLSSSDTAVLFGIDRATMEICDDDIGKYSLHWVGIYVSLFHNDGNSIIMLEN